MGYTCCKKIHDIHDTNLLQKNKTQREGTVGPRSTDNFTRGSVLPGKSACRYIDFWGRLNRDPTLVTQFPLHCGHAKTCLTFAMPYVGVTSEGTVGPRSTDNFTRGSVLPGKSACRYIDFWGRLNRDPTLVTQFPLHCGHAKTCLTFAMPYVGVTSLPRSDCILLLDLIVSLLPSLFQLEG
eukprot:sb/3471622/